MRAKGAGALKRGAGEVPAAGETTGADARRAPRGLVLVVTPSGALAAAALTASLLLCSFAAGRRWGRATIAAPSPAAGSQTIEQVKHQTPLRYDTLSVDRGSAPDPDTVQQTTRKQNTVPQD